MKQKNNSFMNREFWFERTPEYFNVKFQLLTYAIDAVFILYSLFSIPLYVFYHIFGDLGLFLDKEKVEANPSLKDEYLKYYKINDISLFWNLFNIIIPIGFIYLSQQLIKVQTYAFLTVYMGIQKLFIFAYFMNVNLTLIPNKSSFIYTIFNLMLLFTYNLYLIYSIYFYIKNKNKSKLNNINEDMNTFLQIKILGTGNNFLSDFKKKIIDVENQVSKIEAIIGDYSFSKYKDTSYGKYKINLNEQPASIDALVHEVQLRMDMAKMKFNSIMIDWKLNKIFKRLMYQPKDFYFMQKNQEKERQNEHIIRNIKGLKSIVNQKDKFSDLNSQMSDNVSTTFASSVDNNYSRLEDDESEPLKM